MIDNKKDINKVMKSIPRIRFAHLPTPIEEAPRLSKALRGPIIFVKRDDLTGLAFGGNKTRKLEFLVAEAQKLDAKMLITAGAIQSNHCRQTAAIAARLGFRCTLVLTGDLPVDPTGNFLLDKLFGAEMINVSDRKDRDRILKETFDKSYAEGMKPYLVPYGGSSPTGALGYAFAIKELTEQKFDPDWVIIASSSGGTQAGLLLGQSVFGFKGKILGVSIDESADRLKSNVSALASDASMMLGDRINFTFEDVNATDDYCKSGYGVFNDAEREAMRSFAMHEGLLLDPVYTARAAAGMIDLIRKGFFRKDETILFWHTGGQPALFADKYSGSLI
jgi:D-cysteine desulfhydrase family pyridoxal phosphate-dependent enzyme